MKAIQYKSFGHSDVLELNEVNKPTFKEDEVLVKILATTVNPLDIKIREGYLKEAMPIEFPYIPGSDVSGIVEAIGSNVKNITVGDKVYATTYGGSYAEYISINENQAALIPDNISINEAAALAIPLTTAYTLLVETADVKAGQSILIHGASGAVGSIIVQVAKKLGAYIIATAKSNDADRLKSLGADEVVLYDTEDFTQKVNNIDIVADLVGGDTQAKSFQVLKTGGQLITTVMPPSNELALKYGVTAKFIMSNPSSKKLDFLKEWIEQGEIKAQITHILKLSQASEAQDLVSKGGLNGKVVLEIN